MKTAVKLLSLFLPWRLRRALLQGWFGFDLDPDARIGLAWVFPKHLRMAAGARIGHLTVAVHLDEIRMGPHSSIGRGNWITGYPGGAVDHFSHQVGRHSELILAEHSAITNRHLIDCTSPVRIGRFTTFAGFRSQILTHSIDLEQNRQDSAPVEIGAYCFVGTNCVLLGGSTLPDYCVLGASSLLNKAQTETHTLYAGVPAAPIRKLDPGMAYFTRTEGRVR